MSPPRIAAVITCRDLGRTLVEALDSVERQTRPAAEIIIVDDASTEVYTRQVLARLTRNGTRVALGDGRGASAARNLGARLSSAEYLVGLDGDDVLEPGYFEAAATRLDADTSIDFVSCALRAFGAASYEWRPCRPEFVEAVATGAVPHASTMLRRRVWEAVGGFDEDVRSGELLDFWASVIERGFQGIVLDEPFLNYRIGPGSNYRRSIQHETYVARLRHFYAKHRVAVERHGLELIHAKEAFLLSQRKYHHTLASTVDALKAELHQVQQEIAETARALESRDRPRVQWEDLRRPPLSRQWRRDWGTPVDRYFIESYLAEHRADIRGRVLEARGAEYARRIGGAAVTVCDEFDVAPGSGFATASYDCIVLPQTLQCVEDIPAALAECARILRPGGVLFATAPSVMRVDRRGVDDDFWRLTEASARQLFAQAFPLDTFDVTVRGNLAACAAFLHGLSVEEMAPSDLEPEDPAFPLVVTVRAVKPSAPAVPGIHRDGEMRKTHEAVILSYHRIADLSPDSHGLCTPPEIFRQHMACIRDRFLPIGLEDLVHAAATGHIPEGAVAVTLDDGYLDALTAASPILSEFGVPATFFVNTDRLDEPHERWWDTLERVFLSGQALPAVLTLTVGAPGLRLQTTTMIERADALEALNRIAWPLDANGRADLTDTVLAWSGISREPRDTHRVLTSDEVRALAGRPGHAIGAHTTHHLALTTHSAETKSREVVENKAALEGLIQRQVTVFAYPYGDFDAETLGIVSRAGFRAAVTVDAGLLRAGTNRLLLPRQEISAQHHRTFKELMRAIFDPAMTHGLLPR